MLRLAEKGTKLHAVAAEQAMWVSTAVLAALAGYAVIAPSMAWTKADDLLYVLGIISGLSLVASYAIGNVTIERSGLSRPLPVIAMALACYAFISTLWAPASGLSFVEAVYWFVDAIWLRAPRIPWVHFVKVFIIFAAAIAILLRLADSDDRRFPAWFAGGVMIGVLLFLIDALLGYPMIDAFFGPPDQQRINANVEALSLLLWPALLVFASRKQTALGIGLWLATGVAVLQSPSQAAWLSFFTGSFALALTWVWPIRGVWIVSVCATAGVIMAPMLGMAADMILPALPKWFVFEASVLRRVEVWLLYAELIKEAPFFGHGFQSNFGYPTNFAVQIWSELGAVGAALTAAALGLAGLSALEWDRAFRPYLLATGVAIYSQSSVTLDIWMLPALGIRLFPMIIAIQLCRAICDRRQRTASDCSSSRIGLESL